MLKGGAQHSVVVNGGPGTQDTSKMSKTTDLMDYKWNKMQMTKKKGGKKQEDGKEKNQF